MNSIHIIPLLVAIFLAINTGGSGTAPSFSAAIIALGMVKNGHNHILQNAPLKRIFSIWVISPLVAMVQSISLVWIADGMGFLP